MIGILAKPSTQVFAEVLPRGEPQAIPPEVQRDGGQPHHAFGS